jgi:hypothetical protein
VAVGFCIVVRELAVELLRSAFPAMALLAGNFLAETFLRCLSPYHEGFWSA